MSPLLNRRSTHTTCRQLSQKTIGRPRKPVRHRLRSIMPHQSTLSPNLSRRLRSRLASNSLRPRTVPLRDHRNNLQGHLNSTRRRRLMRPSRHTRPSPSRLLLTRIHPPRKTRNSNLTDLCRSSPLRKLRSGDFLYSGGSFPSRRIPRTIM